MRSRAGLCPTILLSCRMKIYGIVGEMRVHTPRGPEHRPQQYFDIPGVQVYTPFENVFDIVLFQCQLRSMPKNKKTYL
jgi:hypothetical protein